MKANDIYKALIINDLPKSLLAFVTKGTDTPRQTVAAEIRYKPPSDVTLNLIECSPVSI